MHLVSTNIIGEYYNVGRYILHSSLAYTNVCYATNFEEVEGAYWFGPVCVSVRESVRYACTRSRTVIDRFLKFGTLCGMSIKIKRTRIVFSFAADLSLQSNSPYLTFFPSIFTL